MDTLICFCEENAVPAMIALNVLPVKELVMISESRHAQASVLEELGLERRELKVHSMKPEDFLKTTSNWDGKAVLVNDCSTFMDFKLLNHACLCGIPLYYADMAKGKVLKVSELGGEPDTGGPVELEVHEIIELAGCTIEESSDEAMDSDEITQLLNYIVQDKRRWDRIRQQLKNNFTV
ncbi:MAG: hypothetical protein N2376_10825, partial [Clostridia bacterium]|nr:hypothetical protein [Clostridia bacterium]